MKSLLAFVAMAMWLGLAHGAGEGAALKNTVAARFKAGDLALMKTTVNRALKEGRDGETLDWKNDKSPASGSATPLDRHRWKNLDCRRVRIVNVHGRLTEQGVYRFCEQPPGRWKLVGPARS